MDNHIKYMQLALLQAKKALDIMEVPVGAVIIRNDILIGAGFNQKERDKNPLKHAEIVAIEEACKFIDDWRLKGSSIYITAEPCIMCAGAILHARIDKVYFGVKEPKFGGVISTCNIFDNEKGNHKVKYAYGFMEEEISQMMKEFFARLRGG